MDYTLASTLVEAGQKLQKQKITVIISGLSSPDQQELTTLQKITPDLELLYMAETGIWDLEQHQKAQDIQK